MSTARSLVRAATAADDVLFGQQVDQARQSLRSARVVGDRVSDRIGVVQVPNNVRASVPWKRSKRTGTPNTSYVTSIDAATGIHVVRNSKGNVVRVTFPDGSSRYPSAANIVRSSVGQTAAAAQIAAMLPAIGDPDA